MDEINENYNGLKKDYKWVGNHYSSFIMSRLSVWPKLIGDS